MKCINFKSFFSSKPHSIPPPSNTTYIAYEVFPDDILLEIFTRSEPKTLARCRCLNNHWRHKLEGKDLAKKNFFITKGRHISIFVSFGYPPWEIGQDQLINIRETEEVNVPVALPFIITDFGWWHVVGNDNGIVCVRYTVSGLPTQLVLWNPLTNKKRVMNDPAEGAGLKAVSIYIFGYMDNSDHYFLIHLSKRRYRDQVMSYNVYNSALPPWQAGQFADSTIQKLGPNGVWYQDSAYWINWVGSDFTHPLSIVRFNCKSQSFEKFKIPKQAKKRFQYLSQFKYKLCYVAYDSAGADGQISVWNIVPTATKRKIWQHMFFINPVGIGYTPDAFISDYIILVCENRSNLSKANDRRTSHISLSMMDMVTNIKKELFCRSWMEEIELKSLTLVEQGMLDP